MTGYTRALYAPFHMQWDADSRYPLPDPGSAPNNCGPASVANIAHFYRDGHYGIYLTRRLAVTDPYRATSITEQKAMLEKRGVPALVGRFPLSSIKATIASGRQPVLLGLFMEWVPLSIAGHPFRGWHAVVALENAVYSGVSGMLIRDPNFSTRTGRTDPTGGKRFYPDGVIQAAFVNVNGWGLMPERPKLVSLPDTSVDRSRLDGDPYPMLMRSLVDPATAVVPWYRLRAGKPIRAGARVTDPTLVVVKVETPIRAHFVKPAAEMEAEFPGEGRYGDVLAIEVGAGSGRSRLGYVKKIDIA